MSPCMVCRVEWGGRTSSGAVRIGWLVAVVLVALLAACGGGSDEAESGAPQPSEVEAEPSAAPSGADAATPSDTVTEAPAAIDVELGTTTHTFRWTDDAGIAIDREYVRYVPEDYSAESSWPLVLYLHGGPGPETIDQVVGAGVPSLVELVGYRFVMVAPLATPADMTGSLEEGPAWGGWTDYLIDLIDHADDDLAVDRDRIYFTGSSLGGFGVFELAVAHPDVPAALVSMSGGWASDVLPAGLCDIAEIPARVIHGSDDETVRPLRSERIVEGLVDCGAEDATLEILEDQQHGIEWVALQETDVVEWMLAQGTNLDWPVLPEHAVVLAEDNLGRPAVWQVGECAYGFSGNPGIKLGMVEDLIMEFEEVPADTAGQLEKLRALQPVLEDELVPIMTGLVQCTSLMSAPKAAQGGGELDAQVI